MAVVFFDDGDLPIERFVFKLNVNQSYCSKVEDLEFSLRSVLIKLPLSEPLTRVLPRSKCGSTHLLQLLAAIVVHCAFLFFLQYEYFPNHEGLN